MNELQAPVRFLSLVVSIILALGLMGSLGQLTYHMAQAALEAQSHDQMSYGKFSRQLWSRPARK